MIAIIVEPTITAGNIISLVGTLVPMLIAGWKISSNMAKFGHKIDMMWAAYKKQHNIDEG